MRSKIPLIYNLAAGRGLSEWLFREFIQAKGSSRPLTHVSIDICNPPLKDRMF